MSQKFFQGRTNNHLTWVFVDATDFATPESALSAAAKIKIYGKTQGATGVNFVSSGTGSLTNDIQHVGAAATGQYTIALAKADLSDASAAWYDQYIVTLSATGAAYQTLVVEGVLSGGNVSNVSAAVSDVYSAVLLTQSMASDAASAAQQGSSRTLIVQSRLSDLDSRLSSDTSDIYSNLVVNASRMVALSDVASNIYSGVTALSDASSNIYSLLTAVNASVSDISSDLGVMSGVLSDAYSNLVVNASRMVALSDAVSNVYSATLLAQSLASDAHSAAALAASAASDIYSLLTTARAEPGQSAPAASKDPLAKIDFIYKDWRNRKKQTTTKYLLYNDDGTTVGQSAAATDDGATSFVRAEMGTGA